ncbi:hypothetical protein E2K93_03615 [Thalassotalea sp. HSM 43]|uniref:ATP-binding protein n=1 Tax=Thalassotalea sp. HSM 43 TaxID=2552945 RepID=UPI001080413C|nr:ATP-binding protein [Thalassotalea sp. HSM 43]QBY03520.1 hypothetical protein E2K93_03615 [Thalassotalea sp. HSM 43]
MLSQFTRLYALIVLFACLIIYLFNQLYHNVVDSGTNYQIDIEQVFQESKNTEVDIIATSSIALPSNLQQELSSGRVIQLVDDQQKHYFYQKNAQGQLLRYGPIDKQFIAQDEDGFYLIIMFYSALAILVLSFIWPLFRDLSRLQKSALQFGQHIDSLNTGIKANSNIYPLAKTFEKMSHQISASVKMHQDLSRTIAHEIRTPLARMKFLSEIVAKDIASEHRQRLVKDVQEIEQLMAEYLSFERLEHDQVMADKQLHNVDDFFAEIADKFSYQKHGFDIAFHSTAAQAYFDQPAMARALQNLINNAIRYAQNTISVQLHIEDGLCQLTVADDGPGVGKEAYKLIQPFIRKQQAGGEKTGFGLGLYIVRKIMIWHQGHVELTNCEQLQGAKISLVWPNKA